MCYAGGGRRGPLAVAGAEADASERVEDIANADYIRPFTLSPVRAAGVGRRLNPRSPCGSGTARFRRMKHFWLFFLLLLARTTTAAAQVTGAGGATRPPAFARDTTKARPIQLGLARLPAVVPIDFRLPQLDTVLFSRMSFHDYVRDWATNVRFDPVGWLGLAAGRTPDTLIAEAAVAPQPAEFLPPPPVRRDTTKDLLPGALGRYADIGMKISGVGEMGGSWTRFHPCDPSLHLNCNPGLFPQIKPNVQFSVQVGGTISDRVHLNVDYDQTREETFNSNLINVFYQGMPDEVLQRVEVGDVQFALPRSRYLTQGIPAGNFGLMASGQLGPIDFQFVGAQQRGDLSTKEFRLGGGAQQGLVQDDQIVIDDADYVKGQFFFLVNPDSLASSPHIDALQLRASDAPTRLRPAQGGIIQIYRDERIPPASGQQQVNLFLANAVSEDGQLKHSGQFRRLDPDQDYIVHQSGLWIMLRSPLRTDEALAISYVTESGDTVGTINAEQSPPGTTPTLRLLRSPVATHQPGSPTWRFEMHQVYRVNSSSGVDLSTVDLRISLGDIVGGSTFRDNGGTQVTFLRLFGLDEDAPTDKLDIAQIFQPDALTGTQGSAKITGTYIVFPTLEPFLTPPPVPSAGLTATAAKALLGSDANQTIYLNTDPVARDGGGRFRLNLAYRVQVEGLASSFSLGQFGIREGSERVSIGDRKLERGVDYNIDYEIGQVTLTDPTTLFAANPNAEIRVQLEQRSLFQIAPTSIYGANLTYRLGERGALHFVGLYQSQRTLYARPQLGTEPAAIFLGGVSADLDLGGAWLDHALARMPGMRSNTPARLTLSGEMATSDPDPNRRGQAYFDDFEGTDQISIDVRRQQWKLGSRPDNTTGDDGLLPPSRDATNAARLVWQHDFSSESGVAGSLVPQRDIDRQINIVGNQLPEPAMWLTFGDHNNVTGQTVWRSITTVLSTTGRDMTRDEYFEFYVSEGGAEPMALIFDFGSVGEDGFYVDSAGHTTGTYREDGRPWGLGVLDEEARISQHEVWGSAADGRGLWDQPCQVAALQSYPLGDERSNCTRGNGVADTEDLDGNGVLDENDGPYFRYVVRLDQAASPYLVRDTAQTGTGFRLYRIRLRDGAAVNGANDGTWRFIKHLRMTVVGAPGGIRKQMVMARMNIVGSRWIKRNVSGVLSGLLSDQDSPSGGLTEVQVGPVSAVTVGADYAPPPGVSDQLQDPSAQFGASGVEVNEKSLRIGYTSLQPEDRAEVYFRYPQQPRPFMTYRQLRVWAVAHAGQWGPTGPERLVIKVGTDPRNYYLYMARLPHSAGGGAVHTADWLPELTIDFQRWFDLRAQAEEQLARSSFSTNTQDTVWSADSTYALVLEDRARAPNLAAIREFSLAVYNGGGAPVTGEVWIDDIRLDHAVQDPGGASNVTLDLQSDALSATLGYSSQSAVFRSLSQDASYVGTGDLSLSTRAQLDHVLPASWGLDIPISVTHSASVRNPSFLERSDVPASGLQGLRDSGAGTTSFGMRISKRTPSSNALLGLLVDGTSISLGYDAAHTNTITSRNESGAFRGGIDYHRDIARHDIDILPGFVENALRAITPDRIERSAFFQRLLSGRMRWTPQRLGFGTLYRNANAKAFRYSSILADPGDATLAPILSPQRGLDNTADIAFAPFDAVVAGLSARSSRDLLDPDVVSALPITQDALRRARSSVAGTDVGWETSRSLTSSLSIRPVVADWLRPSWSFSNRFQTNRDPSFFEVDVDNGDSLAVLQRRFGSDRRIDRRLDIQPGLLVRSLERDSVHGSLLRLISNVQSLTMTWNSGLTSSFDRETRNAASGYQLGLGGLAGFRALGADTAVTTLQRMDLTAGGITRLPLSGQLALRYTNSSSNGFDIRGGARTQQNITWPSLRVSWSQIPLPAALSRVLLSASIGGGYERGDQRSAYGGSGTQARGLLENRYPFETSVTIAGGVTVSWNATITRGTTLDPTGNGQQDGTTHTIQFASIVQPPAFMKAKFKSPISARLMFTQDNQRRCRITPLGLGNDPCVNYLDTANRNINFTLDTVLSDITVGMRLNYTGRDSHVGTTTGSSQLQFAIFGQFNFAQGAVGGVGGR